MAQTGWPGGGGGRPRSAARRPRAPVARTRPGQQTRACIINYTSHTLRLPHMQGHLFTDTDLLALILMQ